MRVGMTLNYSGGFSETVTGLVDYERAGLDIIYVPEAYSFDAVSQLGYIAARTERLELASGILQIYTRTPALTAMTAAGLDFVSGGRFTLGIGASGPQVIEGFHGVPYTAPLGHTRELVEICRMVWRRERVEYRGEHYTLPLPDGPGKALTLTVHPVREQIPIYLAAVGPKNLELAGEIADGWLAVFYSAEFASESLAQVAAGRSKVGKTLEGFDVVPTAPLVVGDDWQAAADAVRPYASLYVGGMGSRDKNFYNNLACRMGFEAEAAEVQDKFLAKDYPGAMAALPVEFLDATSLLGPVERIADSMQALAGAGVTTLTVSPMHFDLDLNVKALRAAAEALDKSGVA